METVKRAIKGALEKGDAQDKAFREKVYRQAFAALERSLQARTDLPAEEVQERRERVKAMIVEIESGYQPAAPQRPEAPPQRPAPPPPQQQHSGVPSVEHGTAPQADFAPRIEREDRLSAPEPPNVREKRPLVLKTPRKRRRTLALPMVIGLLIAFVAVGAWWAVNGGIPRPADNGGAANRAPALSTADESNWITLFSPDDPTTVRASAGTEVTAMREDSRAFLRVSPGTGEGSVSFDVGSGVLERLAGRRAVFSIAARADDGEETQLSISCDFGPLGTCGRRRYVAGSTTTEYLFEADLPAAQPTAGGTITLLPDIEGRGRTLDVFSLRVSVDN